MNTIKKVRFMYVCVLCLLLSSCDIITIKGEWKTNNEKGNQATLNIDDETFTIIREMKSDHITSKEIKGTWIQNGDTLELFSTAKPKPGKFVIKKITQDNLVLQEKGNERVYLFQRHYNSSVYSEKYIELLKIDGGFWNWLLIGTLGVTSLALYVFILGGFFVLIFSGLKQLIYEAKKLLKMFEK